VTAAVLVLAVLAVGAALVWRSRFAPKGPLDAVPASSFLVATADVELLRASPLGPLVKDGGLLPKLLRIGEVCGVDVPSRTREVAFSMPPESKGGEFGLSMRIDVSAAELAKCASEGSGKSSVTLTTRGSFTLVDGPEGASPGQARIAYRAAGPLLLSEGQWLEEMMAAAEGRAPAVTDASEHGRLRASVEGSGDDRAAFILTGIVPASLRARLRDEMKLELGGAFSGSGTVATVESMLGVESAAVAFSPGTATKDAELRGVLRCATKEACSVVGTFLERERFGLSQDLRLRLLGLGPLINSFAVETKDTEVHFHGRLPARDVGDLARKAQGFLGRGSPSIGAATRTPFPSGNSVVRGSTSDSGAGAPAQTP
jgi:hypothetical protein